MARMALTTDFKIPRLNGANYRDWTFNMRLYLESLDLFGHVDGSIGVSDEEASEQVKQEYKTALKKAWTYICLAVEPDQQIHVRNTTNAKEAWDALKSQFARTSISQIVRLRQKYYSTKFQSGANMLEHINHVKSLHDQLKETRGENVSLRVCKLVSKSVANSWLARVCQVCTHANSQLAYYVQTCCKSGGCQL